MAEFEIIGGRRKGAVDYPRHVGQEMGHIRDTFYVLNHFIALDLD